MAEVRVAVAEGGKMAGTGINVAANECVVRSGELLYGVTGLIVQE